MGSGLRTSSWPCFHYNPIIFKHFNTLLAQPISMIKVASARKLGGLHTDVHHVYAKPFTLVKNKLLSTLTYSILLL